VSTGPVLADPDRCLAMSAQDRFPGYVEMRSNLKRWPQFRTRSEQRQTILGLVTTLFLVWDALMAAHREIERLRHEDAA
jgi:hypothetical protein